MPQGSGREEPWGGSAGRARGQASLAAMLWVRSGVRAPARAAARAASLDAARGMAERVGFEPTWIVMTPTDFESVPL